MRHRRTFTVVREYNFFPPGSKVMPARNYPGLSTDLIYTVVRTLAPICSEDDDSVVFVEGSKYGISGRYLRSAESDDLNNSVDIAEGVPMEQG